MSWRFIISALLSIGGACAALLPIQFASREELFEIPNGTWQRRQAGELVDILPSEIRLVLGVHDILVLKNLDAVPQIFGPTLIMPGQQLRLPFEEVSENQFNCTAHASGQLTVIVEALPTTPWDRLRWRWRETLYGQAQKSSDTPRAHLSTADRLVARGARDP